MRFGKRLRGRVLSRLVRGEVFFFRFLLSLHLKKGCENGTCGGLGFVIVMRFHREIRQEGPDFLWDVD